MFFNLRSFIAEHSYKVDFISTVQVIISFIYIHFGSVIRHARHSFDFFSARSVFLSAERPAMKRAKNLQLHWHLKPSLNGASIVLSLFLILRPFLCIRRLLMQANSSDTYCAFIIFQMILWIFPRELFALHNNRYTCIYTWR